MEFFFRVFNCNRFTYEIDSNKKNKDRRKNVYRFPSHHRLSIASLRENDTIQKLIIIIFYHGFLHVITKTKREKYG